MNDVKISKFSELRGQLTAKRPGDFVNITVDRDGKELVNDKLIPIKHKFSDQLYMRQMNMPTGSLVISAIHHTHHFWFLLTGRILVTTDGETVEHIAPCFEKSIKISVYVKNLYFYNI